MWHVSLFICMYYFRRFRRMITMQKVTSCCFGLLYNPFIASDFLQWLMLAVHVYSLLAERSIMCIWKNKENIVRLILKVQTEWVWPSVSSKNFLLLYEIYSFHSFHNSLVSMFPLMLYQNLQSPTGMECQLRLLELFKFTAITWFSSRWSDWWMDG